MGKGGAPTSLSCPAIFPVGPSSQTTGRGYRFEIPRHRRHCVRHRRPHGLAPPPTPHTSLGSRAHPTKTYLRWRDARHWMCALQNRETAKRKASGTSLGGPTASLETQIISSPVWDRKKKLRKKSPHIGQKKRLQKRHKFMTFDVCDTRLKFNGSLLLVPK